MKGLEKIDVEVHLFLLGNPAKFYSVPKMQCGVRIPHFLKYDPRDFSKTLKNCFNKGVFLHLPELEGVVPKVFGAAPPHL